MDACLPPRPNSTLSPAAAHRPESTLETPGGTLLRAAHMDLEGICMDREVKRITEGLANEFARLCYNGF